MDDGTIVAITVVFAPALILAGLVIALISDAGTYILLGGLSLFFLIIGAALVSGHAIGMVAGVNSMTESEKREYDLKKVGKAVGLFMFYCSALPVVILFYNGWLFTIYLAAFLLMLVWLLWYINVRCHRAPCRGTIIRMRTGNRRNRQDMACGRGFPAPRIQKSDVPLPATSWGRGQNVFGASLLTRNQNFSPVILSYMST